MPEKSIKQLMKEHREMCTKAQLNKKNAKSSNYNFSMNRFKGIEEGSDGRIVMGAEGEILANAHLVPEHIRSKYT